MACSLSKRYLLLKEKDEWKKAKQRGLRRAVLKASNRLKSYNFWSAIILIILLRYRRRLRQFHGIGNNFPPQLSYLDANSERNTFRCERKTTSWTRRQKPAKQLIRLQNGSIKLTEFMSHPHPLPWSQYGTMINKDQLADERSKLILGYQYEKNNVTFCAVMNYILMLHRRILVPKYGAHDIDE